MKDDKVEEKSSVIVKQPTKILNEDTAKGTEVSEGKEGVSFQEAL